MAADARVGAYRILRLINRGGQGRVYLGYDDRLRRRVAIKILPLPPERHRRSELLREAQLIASMDSSRVVQIYDVVEGSEHLALVMAYVPGCDLRELLASRELSLSSILTIATDISAALAAARQQHILHGDLKPGNVLISSDGRVKLADFGISRLARGGRVEAFSAGSLSAVSPEQYRGESLDSRSDLFSLGCLLYRLITGVRPFFRGGRLVPELLLAEDPEWPGELAADGGEVPAEFASIIMRLLNKSPDDRPSNTHELRSIVRKASRDLSLSSTGHLLEQAAVCFRPESADDIPVQIPADLGPEGRSHLSDPRSIRSGWAGKFIALRRFTKATILICATALLALTVAISSNQNETAVGIYLRQLDVAGDVNPPPEISAQWLVAQVSEAVREQLGSIRVLGDIGATPVTTLYAGQHVEVSSDSPDESIEISLRCKQGLCVVALQRVWEQGHSMAREQLVLFPDAPIEQWREIIEAAARELYP